MNCLKSDEVKPSSAFFELVGVLAMLLTTVSRKMLLNSSWFILRSFSMGAFDNMSTLMEAIVSFAAIISDSRMLIERRKIVCKSLKKFFDE